MSNLNLSVELKDIKANLNYREELIALGGKKQVPYLVDQDQHEAMYESEKIINYLEKHYGQLKKADLNQIRVNHHDQICDVDV